VSASLKLLHNSNLLQISISGMPVVEASDTIDQCSVYTSISVFRFGLLHGRKCSLTHVCASKHRVHF